MHKTNARLLICDDGNWAIREPQIQGEIQREESISVFMILLFSAGYCLKTWDSMAYVHLNINLLSVWKKLQMLKVNIKLLVNLTNLYIDAMCFRWTQKFPLGIA